MEIPKAVNNYNTFIFIHSINKLHLNLSVQIYDFISDAHDFLYQSSVNEHCLSPVLRNLDKSRNDRVFCLS